MSASIRERIFEPLNLDHTQISRHPAFPGRPDGRVVRGFRYTAKAR